MGLVFFHRMARIAAAPQPHGAHSQRRRGIFQFFRCDLIQKPRKHRADLTPVVAEGGEVFPADLELVDRAARAL